LVWNKITKKPQHLSKRITGNKITGVSANKRVNLKEDIMSSSSEEDEDKNLIAENQDE
jgi:hypothetical protein